MSFSHKHPFLRDKKSFSQQESVCVGSSLYSEQCGDERESVRSQMG